MRSSTPHIYKWEIKDPLFLWIYVDGPIHDNENLLTLYGNRDSVSIHIVLWAWKVIAPIIKILGVKKYFEYCMEKKWSSIIVML